MDKTNARLLVLLITKLFLFNFSFGQTNDSITIDSANLYIPKKPFHEMVGQKASSAKHIGSYMQIVNATKTSLSPGDSLSLDYYLSGYGYIDFTSAKIFFSSSANILDENESYLIAGFKPIRDEMYTYGGVEVPLKNQTLTLLSASVVDLTNGQLLVTYFDDFTPANALSYIPPRKDYRNLGNVDLSQHPLIHSESRLGLKGEEKFLAPLTYKLKLKNDALPGDYYFTLVLTYFDGNSWRNDRVELKIQILRWYERYNSSIQWAALIIAVLTIITLLAPAIKVIKKLINYLKKLWEYLSKRIFRKKKLKS